MVKIRKYANFIERFLHGEKGQRFFNFAYSIGAAIVIWGALFKILHLPGGNTLLCIGMGTEIAMFLLTAFDRPPKDYHWEEVFPVLDSRDPADRPKQPVCSNPTPFPSILIKKRFNLKSWIGWSHLLIFGQVIVSHKTMLLI